MKVLSAKIMLSGAIVCAAGSVFVAEYLLRAEPAIAGSGLATQEVLANERAADPKAAEELDPTVLKDKALKVLDTYCISCHGPKEQKGKVRLDALETIDPVDLQTLLGDAKETVYFEEMPPPKAKQPSKEERELLVSWLETQVSGQVAKALEEKLQRFEYGNVVRHADLFSGDYAELPASTPDRRWMISEYIFNEHANRLLNYQPTRTIYGTPHRVYGDSGIHWSPKSERGNKFRRSITNPFLLSEKVGVRYSVHERLTTGHLLTMVGNAKRIAGHMSSEDTMRRHYPAMFALMKTEFEHRETLRVREQFLLKPGHMQQLLKDIYGENNQVLLPELVRLDIPYPGMRTRIFPGQKTYRIEGARFLDRFDKQDLEAVLSSIATYMPDPIAFTEDTTKVMKDDKGTPWSPYLDSQREIYENVVLQAEHDWFMQGVSDYRIKNRITVMKLLWDHWDMGPIYNEAKKRGPVPAYRPVNEAEMQVVSATIKKHRVKGDTYQQIIDKCMADWENSFKAERVAEGDASDEKINAFVHELFATVFEREPTPAEFTENIELFELYLTKLDRQGAIAKLIESLVLSTEFAYRYEFGKGEPDEHGRRMLAPRDAAHALAYALTDSSPDEELMQAVADGELNTREDYEREIRRMLDRRDKWTIIDESVQAANLNASVTNQPIRKLRFFRDFFGYPKAMKVFKDDHRFGAGRNEQAVSRLIDEADMLVEYILEKDENVFEELLTTDRFYIFHNGDNASMQAASDELRSIYDRFKDKPWQDWQPEDIAPYVAFLKTNWEFQREKDDDFKGILRKLQRLMAGLELHFSEGQSGALPYMKNSMGFWHGGPVLTRTGQQMRGEQVTSYWNLDWRTWDYPTEQPAKIPNRKGILTHPAWLIAHSMNLETDPIHRGKWVREKLLAGTIPDVPITVDAVIHPDKEKTLRQRMEARTGAPACWRCHEKMDPLGFPFEQYDDFGRFRTDENLEHPENLIKEAPRNHAKEGLTYGARLAQYKTLPVDPRGVLKGTDDPELDGEVEDAFDLIDRLSKSDKVRQSIIRHAFRYFMGRNETLSDSKTLMDAEQAYIDSNGSFDEVIVSLLTSDSFIYRKPNTTEK